MISKLYKIAIAGEGATGKHSICRQFLTGEFLGEYFRRAVGTISTPAHSEPVKLEIWLPQRGEGMGSPDEISMAGWFRGIRGLILVYDITRKRTFEELPQWLEKTLKHSTDFPVAIVGNKIDFVENYTEYWDCFTKLQHKIGTDDIPTLMQYYAGPDTIDPSYGMTLAEEISDKYNVPTLFMETSAKTGYNIQRLFSEFAEIVANHWREE